MARKRIHEWRGVILAFPILLLSAATVWVTGGHLLAIASLAGATWCWVITSGLNKWAASLWRPSRRFIGVPRFFTGNPYAAPKYLPFLLGTCGLISLVVLIVDQPSKVLSFVFVVSFIWACLKLFWIMARSN
mgnify:CR=1 FL=1|jgi:hypothetical protein